jgi:hypothetical protein
MAAERQGTGTSNGQLAHLGPIDDWILDVAATAVLADNRRDIRRFAK